MTSDPVPELLEEVIAGLELRLAFEAFCAQRDADASSRGASDETVPELEPLRPAP